MLSKAVQKISVLEHQKKVSLNQSILADFVDYIGANTRIHMRRDKSVESDGEASLSNVNAIKMIPMD